MAWCAKIDSAAAARPLPLQSSASLVLKGTRKKKRPECNQLMRLWWEKRRRHGGDAIESDSAVVHRGGGRIVFNSVVHKWVKMKMRESEIELARSKRDFLLGHSTIHSTPSSAIHFWLMMSRFLANQSIKIIIVLFSGPVLLPMYETFQWVLKKVHILRNSLSLARSSYSAMIRRWSFL